MERSARNTAMTLKSDKITMNKPWIEWPHDEFMRAAAVANIAVDLAKLHGTEPETEIGAAWDLVDNALDLRRDVRRLGIPLK